MATNAVPAKISQTPTRTSIDLIGVAPMPPLWGFWGCALYNLEPTPLGCKLLHFGALGITPPNSPAADSESAGSRADFGSPTCRHFPIPLPRFANPFF